MWPPGGPGSLLPATLIPSFSLEDALEEWEGALEISFPSPVYGEGDQGLESTQFKFLEQEQVQKPSKDLEDFPEHGKYPCPLGPGSGPQQQVPPYSTQPRFPIITRPLSAPRYNLACRQTTPKLPTCNLRNGLPVPKLHLSLHRQNAGVQRFRGTVLEGK